MSVKIIRRGTPPSEFVYENTCVTCMTMIHYQTKDLSFIPGDRPGDKGAEYVPCPICNASIWHKKATLVNFNAA